MITVIGKREDVRPYIGLDGYNVLQQGNTWTPAKNQEWLDESMERGDKILIVSNDYSGVFRQELIHIFEQYILK